MELWMKEKSSKTSLNYIVVIVNARLDLRDDSIAKYSDVVIVVCKRCGKGNNKSTKPDKKKCHYHCVKSRWMQKSLCTDFFKFYDILAIDEISWLLRLVGI